MTTPPTLKQLALGAVAVLLSPVVLFLAGVWTVLGLLFTLSYRRAVVLGSFLLWSSWMFDVWGSHDIPLGGPLSATAGMALSLVVPKYLLFSVTLVWVQVIVYCSPPSAHWFLLLYCFLPVWSSICRLRSWLPADEAVLHEVESQIYKGFLGSGFSLSNVAGLGTVHIPYDPDKLKSMNYPRTLVLVHGYGAGNAFWAANLRGLSRSFNVYAVEWNGIGRSLRPKFQPRSAAEADAFFVESLEEWRKELGIDRFILCGHSMGGMFATYYASKYGDAVDHLLLVSPAGVNASPLAHAQLPLVRRIAYMFNLTPMSAARWMGPLGPRLVHWMVKTRTSWTPPSNAIRMGDLDLQQFAKYCYHNWALEASGDIAVHTHLHPGAAARGTPLCDVLVPEKWVLPVTLLYGGGPDWMPKEHGEAVVRRLQTSKSHYATLRVVPLSGHQVFMDNPSGFNLEVAEAVDDWELHRQNCSVQGGQDAPAQSRDGHAGSRRARCAGRRAGRITRKARIAPSNEAMCLSTDS